MMDNRFDIVRVPQTTGLAVRKMEADLMAAIAECEDALRRGESDLLRMKGALRSLRRQLRPVGGAPSDADGTGNAGSPSTAAGASVARSDAEVIRSFARDELRKAGHPLNRVEIANRLAAAGVVITAKAPLDRVAKVMWQAKEFDNVGDGYWFAGEPVPAKEP